MDTKPQSLALAGVTGGAGTTRLTAELGATLARAGRDVALVDAAYATQGLSRFVGGALETDITDVVSGEATVQEALSDLPLDLSGRLAVAPAHATFEQLARAKSAAAAERLADTIGDLTRGFDVVIADTPPLAANQAVAAATAADAVALVAPATQRGLDAVPTIRGRLQDVGATDDHLIANRADGSLFASETDLAVPVCEDQEVETPTCATATTGTFAPAVAAVTEGIFDTNLGLDFEEPGFLKKYTRSR
ncbi:AAA family ATPase [Haladaptatus sp. GCM10025707]|uniref:AAA family ATPase n=1 Tax=unclassified Haladaptatus TaxID=2622732 RepID=UPI0023E871E3|nr:AAA family ATPase [Haladaptatus sp. QDMS2]